MEALDTRLEKAFRAYVECALWSSTDGEEPLDANYGPDDIADSTLSEMRGDILDFMEGCADRLADLDPQMIGHDFWLTRNRHGAGFWDRGLGKVGDELTAMAHPYGEVDLYVGDDELIYA